MKASAVRDAVLCEVAERLDSPNSLSDDPGTIQPPGSPICYTQGMGHVPALVGVIA